MPYAHRSRQRQNGQGQGENHRCRLGCNHNPMAIVPIRYGSADEGQEKNRHLGCKTDRTEQEGGTCQAVYQPGLSDHLHPGSYKRNQLAGKEQAIIAVAQGA